VTPADDVRTVASQCYHPLLNAFRAVRERIAIVAFGCPWRVFLHNSHLDRPASFDFQIGLLYDFAR
jgi:hypothetical protein